MPKAVTAPKRGTGLGTCAEKGERFKVISEAAAAELLASQFATTEVVVLFVENEAGPAGLPAVETSGEAGRLVKV
jgi:hypothetical protein